MTVIEVCGQALCMTEASHSFVWPGDRRQYICEAHLKTLKGVADGLGLSVESLDVQPIGITGAGGLVP
jgi:hypothetical protein